MKCRLLVEREVMEFHPGTTKPFAPAEYVVQCVRRDGRLYAPPGAIVDDPQAFWLVRMGQAEAADEECAKAAGLTSEQFAIAVKAAKRLAAGIAPEDFAKFDSGEIVGYNADGSYKRGPNWIEIKDEEDDE